MNPARSFAKSFPKLFGLSLKQRHFTYRCIRFRALGLKAATMFRRVCDAPFLKPRVEIFGRAVIGYEIFGDIKADAPSPNDRNLFADLGPTFGPS